MKLSIQFYSTWAIGSGKGGDSKDSIILKDDNGLPFIPGKTLKGLIRDAYLECGFTNVLELFGQKKMTAEDVKNNKAANLQEGSLRFNSAYLPPDFLNLSKELQSYLFKSKTSTRLEANKQAKEHSLRKNEVCIPLTLTSTILIKKDNSELAKNDYEEVKNALKMLKIMGEKRHRGLGRCKITVPDFSDSQNKSIESNENKIALEKSTNIRFKCTVTEPLVLVKKAKTGQNIEALDYIPGNTFRGIVAGAIVGGDKDIFDDIIFNNTVQFGDAHLLIDGKRSHKTPFSFFYDKSSDDDTLYNFHLLETDDWINKKMKSAKNGYLVEKNGVFIIKKTEYGNRIKSSRNYENRSSEDGGMFSYHYFKKGQEFEFEVNSADTNYLEKITTILNTKTKYFGKSKSAEFGGAIKMKYLEKEDNKETPTLKGKYLYAESNLCFLNEYGEFTATPTAEQLTGKTGVEINWEESQVKFRTFAPYNFHRKNYDFERLIIEKGSVFVFEKEVVLEANFLNDGLGCFKTEGYGKVFVNPDFLNDKVVKLTKITSNTKSTQSNISDSKVVKFIKKQQEKDKIEIATDTLVDTYSKEKYRQQNSSQWARIFNATTRAKDIDYLKHLLWNENRETHNQSILTGGTKKWEESDITIIKDFLDENTNNEILALRKLAKKMISKTSKKDKKNELSA